MISADTTGSTASNDLSLIMQVASSTASVSELAMPKPKINRVALDKSRLLRLRVEQYYHNLILQAKERKKRS